jgi:hypothetical protein
LRLTQPAAQGRRAPRLVGRSIHGTSLEAGVGHVSAEVTMDSRPPITPLRPHHGRHAGAIAVGVLVGTIVVAWTARGTRTNEVERGPAPAAIVEKPVEPTLASIPLGADVETTVAAERTVTRVVTASGKIAFDEARTHHVRSPVAGLLVKTRPSSLGRIVRAGEVVGVVHSLEVYLATLELLAEHRQFRSQEQLDAKRWRLLRWGMRRDQLAQIERTRKPSATLPLIARVTGKVVAEHGATRQAVEPADDPVWTITDPSYATIYAEVPVEDAARLQVGQRARVTARATREITAPIGYISRSVTDGKKTVRVDLHPTRLAPGTQATIELARVTARGMAVPDAAVMRDAGRTVVYVATGEVAEPRDIQLGVASDGYVIVEAGLAGDETIALPR